MKYRSDDGTEEENIWNSRDGVTPFVISLRSGKVARHVDWQYDVRDPTHRPVPGDRIFVDMTREQALTMANNNLNKWLEEDMVTKTGVPLPRAKELADSYYGDGNRPFLVEV